MKKRMTAIMGAMVLVLTLVPASVTKAMGTAYVGTDGVLVSAADAIPDGAYNTDTYESKDYVIPHGISGDTGTGSDYLESLLKEKIFCCGDTITCTDLDMSKTIPDTEYNYCIVNDNDHKLQALIDMGIIDVEYSEILYEGQYTIHKITFKDPTKIVKLAVGYLGGRGQGYNDENAYIDAAYNGITVNCVASTSMHIDYEYYKATGYVETSGVVAEDELLWFGNRDKVATTFYPVIEEGKSYNIETSLPIMKGFYPSSIGINGYTVEENKISDDMEKAEIKVPVWLDNYDNNYDEELSDYYDDNELKPQSNGTYKLPVIDKVLLSISYTNSNNDFGKYTLTFHGNEGTVNGYKEYTLYVPDRLYEQGEVDVVSDNGKTSKDYYNLTYDKIAGLVETPKYDGYEFVRWCQKDDGEQDNYYAFHGLNRTELQKGYWQSDYYSATLGRGFNVDLYAVWKKTETKREEKVEEQLEKGSTKETKNNTGTEKAVVSVGTKVKDASGAATYEVTASDGTVSVAYVAPVSKKKTTITVPDIIKLSDGTTAKVTSIANGAFKKNKKLKKAVIGKNVKKVGKNVFYGDQKLKKITIKSKKIISIGKNTFKGINKKAVIYVPKSLSKEKLADYKKMFKKAGMKKTVKVKKA